MEFEWPFLISSLSVRAELVEAPRHTSCILVSTPLIATPMSSTNALEVLIQALRRLPGVGVKSAQRMAFHLMQHDRAGAEAL